MFHIVHKHPKPLGSVPEPEQTEFQLPHAVQAVEKNVINTRRKSRKPDVVCLFPFSFTFSFFFFFQTNHRWLQYIFKKIKIKNKIISKFKILSNITDKVPFCGVLHCYNIIAIKKNKIPGA